MYAKNVIAASALVAAAAAIPMAKRDIVWETETHVNVVTVPVTTTIWVDPTEAAAAPTTRGHWGHHRAGGHYSSDDEEEVAPAASSTPSSQAPSSYDAPSSYEAPSTSEAPTTAVETSSASSTSVYVAPTTSSSSVYVAPTTSSSSVYVAPTTSSTSVYVAPTTSSVAPSSTYVEPTTTSMVPVPSVYSAPASSAAATSAASSGASGETYTGEITYYTPGLGSCGITSDASDNIVALAHGMMANGANPNNNPKCGAEITISYNGVTQTAKIVDTCPGCSGADLDLTPTLFEKFAPKSEGRVSGVEWWFN